MGVCFAIFMLSFGAIMAGLCLSVPTDSLGISPLLDLLRLSLSDSFVTRIALALVLIPDGSLPTFKADGLLHSWVRSSPLLANLLHSSL